MEEFRDEYTPMAWKASMGEIVWNFHSGFNLYYAGPIKVKPMTEDSMERPSLGTFRLTMKVLPQCLIPTGISILWMTLLYAFNALSPTRQGPPLMCTCTGERIPTSVQANEKKARKAYLLTSSREWPQPRLSLSLFWTSWIHGPSNGAFVNLGKNSKEGKHFVRGDLLLFQDDYQEDTKSGRICLPED